MYDFAKNSKPILQLLILLLVSTALVIGQSQKEQTEKSKQDQSKTKSEQKKEDAKPAATAQPASAPAPLFEGKSTLKSSRQGKETGTAGFNGVNPDGAIQKTVLAATPTGDDQAHVIAMSASSLDPAELTAFEKEGNLNTPK
jgi:hypothetical protein